MCVRTSRRDWAAGLIRKGLAPVGPGGPCWPLPGLSSWQMKESKQSSLALSNPLAPCDQTHPQPARGGRGSSRAGRTRGPEPVSLLQDPGERGIAPGSSPRGPVWPGRGRVWRGEGGVRPRWSRTSRSGNPLPHSLSLQLCRGLANGKRKLGQRKRRQAPRLKNPDKRRGPPSPLAGRRGPGTAALVCAPALAALRVPAPRPPASLPLLGPGQLSLRPPPGPATSPYSSQLCPRCPRRAPQVVPDEQGRGDPRLTSSSPAAPGPTPSPDPEPHLRGPGLRAGRDPDQAKGDSIHRAAAAALWPGHCWGRGQGPGRGGARSFAPPPELRRGARTASP